MTYICLHTHPECSGLLPAGIQEHYQVAYQYTNRLCTSIQPGSLQGYNYKNQIVMEKGVFGTIYRQFENKPVLAIKYLMKVKEGEAVNVILHPVIGYIDIVWGKNDINNEGFGLKHIIEKHGKEIKQLGYAVEYFIPILIQNGSVAPKSNDPKKVIIEGEMFRVIITKEWFGKKKTFVLSAFDKRPIKKKK